MNISKDMLENQIVMILISFLIASFHIFEYISWGRYVYLSLALMIFLVKSNGKFKISIDAYYLFNLAMIGYTFLSAIWAWNAYDSISRGITLLQGFICVLCIYIASFRDNTISYLLKGIKWAGYIVCLYSIKYWGLSFLIQALKNTARMDNDFTNVNSIGMLIAISLTIQIYEIFFSRKIRITSVLIFPSLIVLAATQSRKAMLILLMGIIMVIANDIIKQKNPAKKFFTLVLYAVIGCIALYYVLTLPMFAGMMRRMKYIVAAITGNGDVGYSIRERTQMIQIGWEQFIKTPILGIGISCPHILSAQIIGDDAYLHNNFIELLCGGGILGFSIFYLRYIYIIYNMLKLRKYEDENYGLCFIILLIFLIMDFAYVSYFSKTAYFYWMIYFIYINILKQRKRYSTSHGFT